MSLFLVCCPHITTDTERCFRESLSGVDVHRCIECVIKFRKESALWVYRLALEEPASSPLYPYILKSMGIPQVVEE